MDTDAHESDLTEVVIGAGFLKKVYERALTHELALRGVSAKAQVSFPISYKGIHRGEYAADYLQHRGERRHLHVAMADPGDNT